MLSRYFTNGVGRQSDIAVLCEAECFHDLACLEALARMVDEEVEHCPPVLVSHVTIEGGKPHLVGGCADVHGTPFRLIGCSRHLRRDYPNKQRIESRRLAKPHTHDGANSFSIAPADGQHS